MSSLKSQVDSAKATVANWPADVKAAMGLEPTPSAEVVELRQRLAAAEERARELEQKLAEQQERWERDLEAARRELDRAGEAAARLLTNERNEAVAKVADLERLLAISRENEDKTAAKNRDLDRRLSTEDQAEVCECGHMREAHHPRPPHSCEASKECLCTHFEHDRICAKCGHDNGGHYPQCETPLLSAVPGEITELLDEYGQLEHEDGQNDTARDATAYAYEAVRSKFASLVARAERLNAGALFEFVKHGDEEHQRWLREAFEAYVREMPRPEPRGLGRHGALIDKLRAQVAELEQRLSWRKGSDLPERVGEKLVCRVRGGLGVVPSVRGWDGLSWGVPVDYWREIGPLPPLPDSGKEPT